ncbi:MAG: sodium:solute symporter family protein, partial [Bacteroidota bacterium]
DYLIVYAFLLVILVMGLRAGWNVKDIREYAIANKTFGTGALVLTLLATNIAGYSVLSDSASVFSDGIIMTITLFSVSISFCVVALLVAPKFAFFDDCITMGDLMDQFYGTSSGILAGILGLLNAVFLSGMELVVLGIICETLLGIRASWGTAVGGLVLATYVAHGGIKSVTITDVLQFMVLAIFIPLIAYMAVSKVGSIEAVFTQVPTERLAIFSHPNFSFYLTLFLMWLVPAGIIDPALIQRLLMAKHGRQLRDQYLIAAAFDPTFRLVIMLIGLAGLVLYPHVEAKHVLPTIIHELLPVGIKGMAMAGVLAVCMSTIDSYIHAAGLTLVHDVVRPICVQRGMAINELKWVRYGTVVVGLAAIAIGLCTTDIIGLAFNALEFTGPLLMFPLLSGVMGLKTDKRSFYTALWSTLVAFGMAKWLLPSAYSHFTILISTVVNGAAFFGTHVLQHGGFAVVRREPATTRTA